MTTPFTVVFHIFGASETELRCPICGHEFTVDLLDRSNMVFRDGELMPECPECGHSHPQ